MLARPPLPIVLPPVAVTVAVWAGLSYWLSAEAAVSLGQAVLALAVWHLLRGLDTPLPARAAALVLLVPTVLLDSHGNALCAAACLLALTAAAGRRPAAMLAWFGLALGLSAQALAVAPLFVALALQRRVAWPLWGVAPAMAGGVLLARGWPAIDNADAPTLWALARALPWIGALPLTGLALAATIGASAAFIAWFSARPLHGGAVAEAALLCTVVVGALAPWPGVPGLAVAGILAVALALAGRVRMRIAVSVQAGLVLALVPGMAAYGAIPLLWAAVLLTGRVLRPAANDNPLMTRAARRTS